MKYFIPIKLNRTFTIGPFSALDALIILFFTIFAFRYTLIWHTKVLIPISAILIVLRLRIEEKTVFFRMMLRLKYLLKKTQYDLKESFAIEKNENE